ncbi:MAG TPA: hypothetical protein VI451_10555 [Anaerolineales bacterium]|jgi:hypothetical protein|nr:hypothetical protein [Anaerolineales bacterium]
MPRFIPAPEKIQQARKLIQKARDLPVPAHAGRSDFSYVAQVKAYLEQARDLVKFIPRTPSATAELKEQVKKVFEEADQADRELLHSS